VKEGFPLKKKPHDSIGYDTLRLKNCSSPLLSKPFCANLASNCKYSPVLLSLFGMHVDFFAAYKTPYLEEKGS
jgi:hypothetical protein